MEALGEVVLLVVTRSSLMPRRIIGQCGSRDFKRLEEIARSLTEEQLKAGEWGELSKTEKVAIAVLNVTQKKGVPYRLLRVVQTALVWEGDSKAVVIEYKCFRRPEMQVDVQRFRGLVGR